MMQRQPDTDYNPGGKPFTGRKMLMVMLAFFGVVIGVNFTMAYFALRDFRGVIVDSGYVASQDFNADRALLEAQAARGWRIETRHVGGAPLISFNRADGTPITGLRLSGQALRSGDGRADLALTLVETAPGLYAANEALAPGNWRLSVVAEGEGDRYSTVLDLFIRPDG
jgi:nitrogen fixation protein FixH